MINPKTHIFDGETFNRTQDAERLTTLLHRVREWMLFHGAWKTLGEIQANCGGSEASVSARLRDLRKPHYGELIVERRRVGTTGLWEYRVRKEEK